MSILSLVFSVCAVYLVAYLQVMRPGLEWGDDWAMYAAHARNIVNGQPYLDTNFLYHTTTAISSPSSCPPVFPALLAGLYTVWGFDLEASKTYTAVMAAIALLAIALSYIPTLGRWTTLLLIAFLGGSYGYLEQIGTIGPDLTCVALIYAAFIVHDWAAARKLGDRRPLAAAGLTLLPVIVATFTRVAAAPLAAAVFIDDVWRQRQLRRFAIYFAVGFAALFVCGSLLFPGGVSYWDQFRLDPQRYITNIEMYARAVSETWVNPFGNPFRFLLFGFSLPPAAWAAWRRWRSGPGIREWFFVFFPVMLIAYPTAYSYRYLLPVIPLYLGYSLEGSRRALAACPAPLRRAAGLAGVAALIATAAGNIATTDRTPFTEGPDRPLYRDMLARVRERTPPDSRFALWKPRLFALLTGREAGFYFRTDDDAAFWNNLAERRIDYLILNKRAETDARWLAPHIRRSPQFLEPEYENAEFLAWRVKLPQTSAGKR